MDVVIIIPAHNEATSIGLTINSLIHQSLKPKELIIVNDNSTDETDLIVESYAEKHKWIKLIHSTSSNKHLPGSKIINAFYKGFEAIESAYDILCKFDADLIFPEHYLEILSNHFKDNPKLGMAAGFCYIQNNDDWILEDLTRTDHIRGALKAYRKKCFEDIGGLKKAMGWDTIDELLAKYNGWSILTDKSLKVKHLKPTGQSYNKESKYMQGKAMYRMRYGLGLTLLTGLKMGYKKKRLQVLEDYIIGYLKARKNKEDYLVTENEGKFIRTLRWQGIFNKN